MKKALIFRIFTAGFEIITASGKRMMVKNMMVTATSSSGTINISSLHAGNCFLKYSNGNNVKTLPFVKIKLNLFKSKIPVETGIFFSTAPSMAPNPKL